ncbi:MAG: F0F1 ATP synthase subunit delta [Nocardioidaceae bacterium]
MRGISARSLARVIERVDQEVDGGADAGQLGDELFAIVALLDGQPGLRRILTDPSTDTSAQEGLARKILSDKVGTSTLDVLGVAVDGRWSSARDLPDGLERAGVNAHVAAAEKEGQLDALEDELFRFGRVVAGDHELRRVITDRTVPVAPKQALVETLLSGKATAPALALVQQAVVARTSSFRRTLDVFSDMAAARRERLLATVRAAYLLDESERERLAAALGSKYGQEVHVNVIVDESVIGGLSVEIGDEIIDGTVASRLEDARRRMAG